MYKRISPEDAKKMMDEGVEFTLLDVRTASEFKQGYIKGAILIPDYEVGMKAEKMLPDKDKPVMVYCRSGARSLGASRVLVSLGYENVLDLGGIMSWPYEVVR